MAIVALDLIFKFETDDMHDSSPYAMVDAVGYWSSIPLSEGICKVANSNK
jgi:hypothetical protein